jgi:polyhydroxyalkanoate synthase
LNNGSPGWRPELQSRAAALASDLAATALGEFAASVETELARSAEALITGIEAYRDHPYRRELPEPPTVWREGATRLLDYGPPGGKPVLVVPSLINRAYILDLAPERSLLRYLSGRGIRPLLVDWGQPGPAERALDLTGHIAGKLDQAFEAALDLTGRRLAIMGYCMGGLLALALAERRQRRVDGLVLLATPWDFHAGNAAQSHFIGALAEPLRQVFGAYGEVPSDVLQALFFMADPQLAIGKFSRFGALDPSSAEARSFVATEDWLNDGVPMALPAALDCFGGWHGANSPARGRWLVAGRIVAPQRFERPALVVVAGKDKLAPPAASRPLAAALANAALLEPALGHIGLIIGRAAPSAVWRPVARWLETMG